MTPPNTFLKVAWNMLWACVLLEVASTHQTCDRDVTSIQKAYCSSAFSFRGTVVAVYSGKFRSTSSSDAHGIMPGRHAGGPVGCDVSIEEIFKGLDQKYLGQSVTMHVDYDAAGSYSELQPEVTYLFQADSFPFLDVCDRVDRFSDLSAEIKQALNNHEYAPSCSSPTSENEYQTSGRNDDDTEIKPLVRGNYPARNQFTKPSYPKGNRNGKNKWNPVCNCWQPKPKKGNKKG